MTNSIGALAGPWRMPLLPFCILSFLVLIVLLGSIRGHWERAWGPGSDRDKRGLAGGYRTRVGGWASPKVASYCSKQERCLKIDIK